MLPTSVLPASCKVLEDYFAEVDRRRGLQCPAGCYPLDYNVVSGSLLRMGEQKMMVKDERIDGATYWWLYPLPADERPAAENADIPEGRGTALLSADPQKTLECFALRDGYYALIASGMDAMLSSIRILPVCQLN